MFEVARLERLKVSSVARGRGGVRGPWDRAGCPPAARPAGLWGCVSFSRSLALSLSRSLALSLSRSLALSLSLSLSLARAPSLSLSFSLSPSLSLYLSVSPFLSFFLSSFFFYISFFCLVETSRPEGPTNELLGSGIGVP